jgi:hypothetical protein
MIMSAFRTLTLQLSILDDVTLYWNSETRCEDTRM